MRENSRLKLTLTLCVGSTLILGLGVGVATIAWGTLTDPVVFLFAGPLILALILSSTIFIALFSILVGILVGEPLVRAPLPRRPSETMREGVRLGACLYAIIVVLCLGFCLVLAIAGQPAALFPLPTFFSLPLAAVCFVWGCLTAFLAHAYRRRTETATPVASVEPYRPSPAVARRLRIGERLALACALLACVGAVMPYLGARSAADDIALPVSRPVAPPREDTPGRIPPAAIDARARTRYRSLPITVPHPLLSPIRLKP